jgi:D-hydroxyproline dehydrogenase subunit gamma
MFRRTRAPRSTVTIYFDDRKLTAASSDTVAAALLAAGVERFRGAPYCLICNCFECLVEIDGMPDRQACLVTVADDMRIRRNEPGE